MDPLTIFGAVTGGISAAAQILKTLDWVISSPGKARAVPEEAQATLRSVRMIHRNLIAFEKVQSKLSSVQQTRLSCIPLEDAKNTFIDCVSSLDELETVLLPLTDPSLDDLSLSNRLRWILKDEKIQGLSKRVDNAQSSLGLMLTIMHHESLAEVSNAVSRLAEVTEAIALDVANILIEKRRVSTSQRANKDDASTIRVPRNSRPDSVVIPTSASPNSRRQSTLSTVSARSPNPLSDWTPRRFAFEEDLEQSIAYRRIPRWSKEDISFRSSILNFHALSFLSNQSLGDISAMSVVALPIFKADISNDHHYPFGKAATHIGSESIAAIPSPPPVQSPPVILSMPPARLTPPVSPPSPLALTPLPITEELNSKRRKSIKELIMTFRPTVKGFQEDYKPPQHDVPTPPRTHGWQPTLSSLIPEALTGYNAYSLTQLSTLTIDVGNAGLSHQLGGPPCFGIVGTPEFRDTFFDHTRSPSEILQSTRTLQAKLAAARGYMDFFRCQTCHFSLAQIVAGEKSGWRDFEVWCSCAIKLCEATPFKVCPCYDKLEALGQTKKFYGCRNLASTQVQCAGCFRICAGCTAKTKPTAGAISRSKRRRPVFWLTRLCERQDGLIDVQTQIIEDPGEETVPLRLAILEREITRFGVILDSLNTKQLLLDHRAFLRRTQKDYGDISQGDKPYVIEQKSKFVKKLAEVNLRLKDYGALYEGAVAKEDLVILSDRQAILMKRTQLIRFICHYQLEDSLKAVAELGINSTVRETTTYHIMSQWETLKGRLEALKSNIRS